MVRGCPAGGMMHRFDKVTHRCRCGRWQAGFAPKRGPVKPRAECQICERQQAVDADGCLGHHGYKRPGWGSIHGDCMGVGYRPYPETNALIRYLEAVRSHIGRCRERLAELPGADEVQYTDTEYLGNGRKQRRTRTIRRGEEADYSPHTGHPGFDYIVKIETANLENEVAFAARDEARVLARIANAARPAAGATPPA